MQKLLAIMARYLGEDAETFQRTAKLRFEHRFPSMENSLPAQGRRLWELSPGAMGRLWK